MVTRKRSEDRPTRRPATTPEDRENQIASLAYDLAERQILDGTASSQVIYHFLKQASPRERLERDRLANENRVLVAKVEQLASAKRVEEMYASALGAMRAYSGQDPLALDEPDDYDDDY